MSWCDRCMHDSLHGGNEERCEDCCEWGGSEFLFEEYVPPKYPEYIMKKIRQRLGLDEEDKSRDTEINAMSSFEAFEEVLEWEGFIGYARQIKGWIEDIYKVELKG